MAQGNAYPLTRPEQDLLTYFRALPVERQLEFLEQVEYSFNDVCRMRELAGSGVERGSFFDEALLS